MIVLPAGLPDIEGAAAAAAVILTGMVVSWFASPRPFSRALIRARLQVWLGVVSEWGGVLRGSSVLWAVACGAAVVILHAAASGEGVRIGAYRTGVATIVLFALAAAVALRSRITRLLPRATMRSPSGCARKRSPIQPSRGLSEHASNSQAIKTETWRRAHIALAIGAMLPLWWHCDLGRASAADLLLKIMAILLVMSGFCAIAMTELVHGRLYGARLIKAMFAVHRRLVVLTFLLIAIHVLAVLYFAGI
jgi:hypothetical protein